MWWPLGSLTELYTLKTSFKDTHPAANWEDAIKPGFNPAAAAIAARLAFAGNCAAPCSAAAAAVCRPEAVTITWLVPSAEVRGVEVVCVVVVSLALDASDVEAEAEGEGLREGDVTAEEAGGAVEITVAVLLGMVSVVPKMIQYLKYLDETLLNGANVTLMEQKGKN